MHSCGLHCPGGLVDPRESVRDAAVRECKEETGIDTEFVALAAFRESQSGPFGTSDMYFVAILKLDDRYVAEGNSRPEPTPDPKEIAACRWVGGWLGVVCCLQANVIFQVGFSCSSH